MKLKNTTKKIGNLFKDTFNEFIHDNGIKMSAALSYYTIFSLPPLLMIVISLTGFIFGEEAVNGELFGQINGIVGNKLAMQIQELIKNVKLSDSSTFATIVSVIVLLIGASGVFTEIQESINSIWGIIAKPKRGLIKFLFNRLISFSMIGSVGFILLVGLIINTLMDILNLRLAAYFPQGTIYLFYALNILLSFMFITLLFTVIFKTLPNGKVALKDCIIGAFFTSFLFLIGKFVIGFYLSKSLIVTVYGAAGSIILILGWVYYSAIILFFGAEFTKVYANTFGQKIIPNRYSVKIEKGMLS